ncbi:MAG: hypothetical protein ACYC6V_04050 [Bacillota bacterium]
MKTAYFSLTTIGTVLIVGALALYETKDPRLLPWVASAAPVGLALVFFGQVFRTLGQLGSRQYQGMKPVPLLFVVIGAIGFLAAMVPYVTLHRLMPWVPVLRTGGLALFAFGLAVQAYEEYRSRR